MTQVFDETGVVTPVTIIQAGPCFVTQVKDEKNDGYSAVQLGYGDVSPKRLTRVSRAIWASSRPRRAAGAAATRAFPPCVTCASSAPAMSATTPSANN